MPRPSRRAIVAGGAALAGLAHPMAVAAQASPMESLKTYLHGQQTTGLLIVRDRKTLVEVNWPAPTDVPVFKAFAYGQTPSGALLEDVASQQKSFVSLLVAMAIDKGVLDVNRPVSEDLGPGWSKATKAQEGQIRLIHLLNMNSGLSETFNFESPPGTLFFYNTPAYALTKSILAKAARRPLEALTRDWLTGPAGLTETAWRERPALPVFTEADNRTGLVTSPRDVAKFGQIILDNGCAADGARLVSEGSLRAMFARSPTNPAYGRLWWLNGGAFTLRAGGVRHDGPLIPAAPSDVVAALGALDRRLYIVPSQNLLVVRMGAAALDKDFDQQFWLRLRAVLA